MGKNRLKVTDMRSNKNNKKSSNFTASKPNMLLTTGEDQE